MPTVKFIKEKRTIEVEPGANLRKEAQKAGVELYPGIHKSPFFNCHGFGHCASCRVKVKKGIEHTNKLRLWERINPLFQIARIGNEDELRLACQMQVNGDIEVETQPPMNWHGEKFWG